MERPSVPKFGSFQPKSRAKSTDNGRGASETSGQPGNADVNARGDHQRKERRSHASGQQDHLKRHQGTSIAPNGLLLNNVSIGTTTSQTAIHRSEPEEHNLFIVDRRGDTKNVEYGSLHRYSIPLYRRCGYGNVVGSSIRTKIDRHLSSEKEICFETAIPHGRDHEVRPLTSKRARQIDTKLRFVSSISADELESTDSDFIQFRSFSKRNKPSGQATLDSEKISQADYRSVDFNPKRSTQPNEDDADSDLESDHGHAQLDDDLLLQQQNALLARKAKENSSDIDPWLNLVEFQIKLIRPHLDFSQFTTIGRRNLARMRLSILKEASQKVSGDSTTRERLLITQLEEGIFVWDRIKMLSNWKEALQECPTSITLWMKYIDFIQGDGTSFDYETCKAAYLRCLQTLKAASWNPISQHIGVAQVHVLLRYTCFLRDAGYIELAVATWQTVLEYNFFKPVQLNDADSEVLSTAFEDFWESDVPRVGELGARGWSRSSDGSENSKRNPNFTAKPPLDSSSCFAAFAEEESLLSSVSMLPEPIDGLDIATDPHQHVMFSDLREIIETIPLDVSKTSVMNALFLFFGLPLLPPESNHSIESSWLIDPHFKRDPFLLRKRITEETASRSKHFTAKCKLESAQSLFDNAFHNVKEYENNHLTQFLDRTLEALVSIQPGNEGLAEYYIAFKLEFLPSEASKTAKHLLQGRPTSLRLYNAYALCEVRSDRLNKARGVWSTALQMRAILPPDTQKDAIFLWHGRFSTYVQLGNEIAALEALLAIAQDGEQHHATSEDQNYLSVTQLKTLRELEGGLDRSILSQAPTESALWVTCLAWFTYLTSRYDLSQVFQIYERVEKRLSNSKQVVAQELLQQSKTVLIKQHIDQKRSYKPASIRGELEAGLELFPSNSMLLELYAQVNENDRLHNLIRDHRFQNESGLSVPEWSFRLAEEVRRGNLGASGSNLNTIRAMFTKALSSPESAVTHAPALWVMWLVYEYQRARTLSGVEKDNAIRQTKRIFLDGLRHLPWDKSWALLGMRLLAKVIMSEADLRQIYEVLIERGIRVRIEIA